MRIALVWQGVPNEHIPLASMTIRFDLYAARWTDLGHDVVAYCPSGLEAGFPHPVVTFASPQALTDSEFWRSVSADRVVIITWLASVEILAAARQAGHTIVALADMDGQQSVRLYLRSRFRRTWLEGTQGPGARVRLLYYYLRLLLYRWRKEDQAFIRSVEFSQLVIFATDGARRHFSRCLRLHRRNDLLPKLRVVPYPIDSAFVVPLPKARARRAVAIGRWDSPQKNAHLLAGALRAYLAAGGEWAIEIVGRGGTAAFAELVHDFRQCRYSESLAPNQVAQLLRGSQVLICTSWWESGPVVAFEALASGCTVVSTPIPTIASLLEDDRAGTLSASYRISDFVAAMRAEFQAWDQSLRTPTLANVWQERCGTSKALAALLSTENEERGEQQ